MRPVTSRETPVLRTPSAPIAFAKERRSHFAKAGFGGWALLPLRLRASAVLFRSELRALRRPREGDHVADVAHARNAAPAGSSEGDPEPLVITGCIRVA